MILSSFIYVTLEGATSSIQYFLDEYTETTNQEDFFMVLTVPTEQDIRNMLELRGVSVANFQQYSKNQLMQAKDYSLVDYYRDLTEKISNKFNVTFDGRFYRDVVDNINNQTHTFRFTRKTDYVNLTYLLEGRFPEENHEIAIFREYAQQNDLRIGDNLTIQGVTYVITAFIALPDYIFPIFSLDSPIFNPQTQTVVIGTDEAYQQINERELVLFSGYFREEVDAIQVINEISNFPGIAYAMGNQMNIRISTIDFHLSSNRLLAQTFSNLLLLMCVVIIALILKKKISADRLQIGTLKALGYSQLSITMSYMVYPLLTAFLGSLIGFLFGIGSAGILANRYVVNFILPDIRFYFTPALFIRGVIYPVIVTFIASFVILHFLLKGETISLMQENTHFKPSKITKGLSSLLKPFSFITRFKYSLAFRNLGKVISLFVVVLFASILLVFGFIAFNTAEQVTYRAFSQANYNYEVKFNRLIRLDLEEDETEFLRFQVNPDLEIVSVPFHLYGIDPLNQINPLYNSDGKQITHLTKEGLIINEFIARAYGLDIGDTLTLQVNGRNFTYPISGVVSHFNGAMMYISLEQLRNDLNLGENQSNGKWTNQRPLNNQDITYIFSMDELAQNIAVGMEMIRISLQVMVIVSIIIGSFMMIVITNFIIDENQKQISVLKVLGYTEKEISKMVLTIYFPFVIVAYFLGILITRSGIDFIMSQIAARLPFAIPTEFTTIQTISGLLIVGVTYLIAIRCSKCQLDKISLQEVLKY